MSMAWTTHVKTCLNLGLRAMNLRLDTLTAERRERQRLNALARNGYFTRPPFSPPAAFTHRMGDPILSALSAFTTRFDTFVEPSSNEVGYTFNNPYFTSPDTEVLYTTIRTVRPRRVIEVGCGHSTQIMRQAILDGHLNTRLIAIDPRPRLHIRGLVDEFYPLPLEMLPHSEMLTSLQAGDILFIDSSHEILPGNDVVVLYLQVLPLLPPGVLIHIHDIFLPYEYPREWILDQGWPFHEQYLVQALLTYGNTFEALWAGHFLQHTLPDFTQHFRHLQNRVAKSLWLRKRHA
jgi:hypothetical protein